jgi:hypothetical protein
MVKKKKGAKCSPEKRAEIKAAREQKLTEASARLASGVEALLKDNRWKEYLQFSMRFHQYSFFNMMLIMLQRPDATIVAGFETWKSMGRHVKKGEHGMDIFVPMFAGCRRKKAAAAEEAAFGEEETTDDEPDEGSTGEEGKTLVGFKIGHVFDVSQTDGAPLPERPYTRLEGGDAGMFEVLKAALEDMLKIPITSEALFPGQLGYCKYSSDPAMDARPEAIVISNNPSLSGAQKLEVLAHEVGHALLHSGTEYRQHSPRSIRELEAESVAFCTLAALGFDTSAMSFGYIATWAESAGADAVKEIENSGQRILDASRRILDWIDEHMAIPVEIEAAAEKESVAA